MKHIIYILILLTVIGCGNYEKNNSPTISDRVELVPELDKALKEEYEKSIAKESQETDSINCTGKILDFLKLKDNELQTIFFSKLDSIRKVQYPDNNQEISIMVDLTPKYLNKFLSDIISDSLSTIKRYEKEYHFNIAPKDFTDPEICMDKITVNFDVEHCSFRLNVFNTFLVEPNWCKESKVVYGFKIKSGKIIDFWRQEAG